MPAAGQSFQEAFSNVTFLEADNNALVEDDFNEALDFALA